MASSDFNYHGDVVVFDLDDTLIRERDYVQSGFRLIESTLCSQGLPAVGISGELGSILESRGRYFDWLEEWLCEHDAPKGLLSTLIDTYRRHVPASLDYAEGAKDLLDHLSGRGAVIGIVTDGRSATQRAKIKALGLDQYVRPEDILISEETGHDKAVPHNFRHFVARYPEARRFFYIADNERKDFLTPNLLGWTTVRAPYNPDNVHEDFVNNDILSRPGCILASLTDFSAEFQPKGE